MQKVFIDADIFLDLLAEREPFYQDAAKIFSLIDSKQIEGYTSPVIFANLHYIIAKQSSRNLAKTSLKKLRTMIKIVTVTEKDVDLSLESDFNDFEDAIQHYAAISNGISTLITRNTKDYKKASITVCSPEEFLKMWNTL